MGKKETYFDEAEDLYVVEGLSLEAIAARLGPDGPSVTSLSIWKQEGEWSERRRQWVQAQADLKKDSLVLKQKLLKRALEILNQETPGPQELYAATSIANRVGRQETKGERVERPEENIDRPALFLEDLDFIANVLKETDPEGLKILARNFDLIVNRFKKEHAKTA